MIKLGRGDQVENIESHLILLRDTLSLYSIASIFHSYAKFIPVPIKRDTQRRNFILQLCEILLESPDLIKKNQELKNILKIMYAMATARILEIEPLWRSLCENLKSKNNLTQPEDLHLYSRIEQILNEHKRIDLLHFQDHTTK